MSAKTSILWYLMFNRHEVWINTQKLSFGLVFLARREKIPAVLSCLKHHYLWCLQIFHTWKPVACLQEKYSSFPDMQNGQMIRFPLLSLLLSSIHLVLYWDCKSLFMSIPSGKNFTDWVPWYYSYASHITTINNNINVIVNIYNNNNIRCKYQYHKIWYHHIKICQKSMYIPNNIPRGLRT